MQIKKEREKNAIFLAHPQVVQSVVLYSVKWDLYSTSLEMRKVMAGRPAPIDHRYHLRHIDIGKTPGGTCELSALRPGNNKSLAAQHTPRCNFRFGLAVNRESARRVRP